LRFMGRGYGRILGGRLSSEENSLLLGSWERKAIKPKPTIISA